MKLLQFSTLTKSVLIAVGSITLGVASSFAAPISFTTSVGVQPSDAGSITLTQVNANTVKIYVDLLSGYGFMNTGGPHTPFAFNLNGSEAGVSITFIQPVGGSYPSGTFSLNLGGGDATPFGSYGIAIDSSAGNGSGNAYYGDLEFNLTRTTGLLTTDFIANGDGYYFGADLTDGKNTGSQAWKTPSTTIPVPDGGATLALFGIACIGIGFVRRNLV